MIPRVVLTQGLFGEKKKLCIVSKCLVVSSYLEPWKSSRAQKTCVHSVATHCYEYSRVDVWRVFVCKSRHNIMLLGAKEIHFILQLSMPYVMSWLLALWMSNIQIQYRFYLKEYLQWFTCKQTTTTFNILYKECRIWLQTMLTMIREGNNFRSLYCFLFDGQKKRANI